MRPAEQTGRKRRDLAELCVGYALVLVVIWTPRPWQRLLYCAAAVFLASAASDGISGKLLSAVWDPWETLASHRDDLRSDIYTLRRIVPKDRGLPWGNR